EVVVEALVVRVDLRAALVAHTLVPGATGVHAVELAPEIARVRLARDHVVGVPGQVRDPEVADALRLRAVPHALPEARELLRVTPRNLDHVGRVPRAVPVALPRITLEAVRKRLHLRPFAGERPLALGAHPLAHGAALYLGLVEVVHHLGPLAL